MTKPNNNNKHARTTTLRYGDKYSKLNVSTRKKREQSERVQAKMAAPSATTSFTFAPKQKQKQSARPLKKNGRGGWNHGKTEMGTGGGAGGNEEDDDKVGPSSDEEETVVCSFGHSSKIVDGWMKKATKEWKEEDRRADRKQIQAAEAFSLLIAGQQPDESSCENARRIGSRAGLGAEVASRKRKQEDQANDESRKRIMGVGGKRGGSHHRRQEIDSKDPEGTGGGDDDSDSEEEFSRTSISKNKKASSSQDAIIQKYKDSRKKPKKKKKK